MSLGAIWSCEERAGSTRAPNFSFCVVVVGFALCVVGCVICVMDFFVCSALRNDFSEARRIAERLGVITGRIVLLDFCEFVDAVRGIS